MSDESDLKGFYRALKIIVGLLLTVTGLFYVGLSGDDFLRRAIVFGGTLVVIMMTIELFSNME